MSTTELAVRDDQLQLLKDTLCRGASDNEFQMAVQLCNRLDLDPFAKQIYFVKRWDSGLRKEVMSPQISIDGMRLVAERSGKYRGQTEPEWCGEDGVWRNVWLSDKPPSAARCGVYRSDCEHPLYAVAKYNSYVATKKGGDPTPFWKKMPEVMLHKCAESLALRKAFPNELSGAYTEDEMAQANNSTQPTEPQKPKALSDMLRFHEELSAANGLGELDAIRPPEGLSKKDLAKARKEWKRRKEELTAPENENQDVNPETGEVIDNTEIDL